MKKLFLVKALVVVVFAFPVSVNSQWSTDPLENLMIRDADGMMVVPHVAVVPSGNSFISWYSATEDLRFDVYMQYLDVQGIKQWPEPGLLISNHATDTWVSDYDLAIDQEGCAILVTQDQRDGFSNAFAYRITPEGQMKWGPDGIRLTEGDDANYAPKVIITPYDDFIFLNNMFPLDTTQASRLSLQMTGKDGDLLWSDTIMMEMMDLYFGQMLITEDENLIVSFLAKDNYPDTLPGQVHWVHVYLQKYDLAGDPLWAEPVQADTGNVMSYGSLYTMPYLANDGAGGAFVAWQSFTEDNPNTLVNHIRADGAYAWPGHGIPVSTNYDNLHTDPSVIFNDLNDNLYIFWTEYHYDALNMTDCWAVAGQRFSPEGERLWSDTAKYLIPLMCAVDSAYMNVNVSRTQDAEIFFTYEKEYLSIGGTDTSFVTEIYGSLIDSNGDFLWPDQVIPISKAMSNKLHLALSDFSSDQWIMAWEDQRLHIADPMNSGIYAQNVTIGGNLGPLNTDENSSGLAGLIRCYPNPCSELVCLEYKLDRKSNVVISLNDCLGNVLYLKNEEMNDIGKHLVEFPVNALNPGVYFIKLRTEDYSSSIKLIKKN